MQALNRESVHGRHVDRREYQALMALSVTCFLIVSVATRVLPRGLRRRGAARGPGLRAFRLRVVSAANVSGPSPRAAGVGLMGVRRGGSGRE